MKASLFFAVLSFAVSSPAAFGQQTPAQMEAAGDTMGARTALVRAVQSNPNNVSALTAYAEFLDRHGDPQAREAYGKLMTALRDSGDTARAGAVSHRVALLDLIAGDKAAAAHLVTLVPDKPPAAWPTAAIPGPLRPFARMAAISADARPEDLLPALARNVVTNGFQASHNNEALEQTEYLKLVHRYLSQARELEKLAGDAQVVRIENCDSPKAGELLRIIGFRMRGGCGSEVVLETVNEPRAFVTTDSGFPVNELEAALRTNRPFAYDFHPTLVPVMFGPDYWFPVKDKDKDSHQLHRELHLRPRRLPFVPGLLQAGPRYRRRAAQDRHLDAAQGVFARAGFLRRDVRDPRRQGRGAGRAEISGRLDRPGGDIAGPGRGILR